MAEEIINNPEEVISENQPVEEAPATAPVEEPVAEPVAAPAEEPAAETTEEPAAEPVAEAAPEAAELPETPKAPRKPREIENVYGSIENFDWNALDKKGKGYTAAEHKNLEELYTKSFKSIDEQQVIMGTVVSINQREIVVNIGFKSDGVISASELRYRDDLKIGDEIEVYVESQEDATGQLILSHKKARMLKSWLRVNEAFEKEDIFDEPTTGLHFHDIERLLQAFNALIERGHTILIIEHNMEIIKMADHIIDIGPDGGDRGGELVACGTPEEIVKNERSITGKYLKNKL